MATRKKKAKWLVKLLKVIVVVYLLLILYQLIGNVYSRLSNTHEIQVPEEWNLIVVNRWNELPEDYDVELTELSNGQMVDSRIYPYLQEMFDAARTEDVYPVVREGYRTAEEQQEILDDKIAIKENISYCVSDNPTEYLCNEAYFYMLNKMSCPVLFVHIPGLTHMSEGFWKKLITIF